MQIILGLDQLVDLINEVRLGLRDNSLNLVNLLVDNLVDLFHVVEHLISLLVEQIKLLLVSLQLDLTTIHLLA